MIALYSLLLVLPWMVRSWGWADISSIYAEHPPTQIAMGSWASWHAKDYPISQIPWDKYTHITYALLETTPDIRLKQSMADQRLLPELSFAARRHGVKVMASIGGWTGSQFFSTAIGSRENRTRFVTTVMDLASMYHLDGIDFDWRYPGTQALGCNTISEDDIRHFSSFLTEFRVHPSGRGRRLYLTVSGSLRPWDRFDWAHDLLIDNHILLDHINIMSYDIWGSWSPTVGPHSALNDTCAPKASRAGSAVSAMAAWGAVRRSRIVLGVPAYGRSWTVPKNEAYVNGKSGTLKLFAKPDKRHPPKGDVWDDAPGKDVCGTKTGPGGVWTFQGLVKDGFLTKKGIPAKGIDHRYNTCSQTPIVYSKTSGVMVSYDDARSFAEKGKFIKDMGLRGFAMWEAGGDYDDILLNSIRKAFGFET